MTEKQFNKLMKNVRQDMINDGLDIDQCAYDVAKCLLFSNPELREYVLKILPAGAEKKWIIEYIAESI